MQYLLLLGRILFSALFIIKGFDHFSPNSVTYAINMGVPMATILVPIGGIIAIAGGLSVLLGYKARFGAWLLIIFLIPTTFMMHKFWTFNDLYHAMLNQFCFMKNISLIGSSLMIAHFGSGPLSISKEG